MSTKQLIVVISVVALLSAGLGVVITSQMAPKEVKVSLDLGGGNALDLSTIAGFGGELEEARVSANENAAIATLRSIAAAQQMFQASGAIDTDDDGGGEYAFFGELAGAVPMRIFDGIGPAAGAAPDDILDPPFLASAFGNVVTDGIDGVVERQGYYFKVYLPSVSSAGGTPGLGEEVTGGTKPGDLATWASANCEIMWCAYAWPVDAEKTGNRVFFINQEGDIACFDNRDQTYEGTTAPAFGAAYDNTAPNSMEESVAYAVMGFTSNDGNIWTMLE